LNVHSLHYPEMALPALVRIVGDAAADAAVQQVRRLG